MTPHPMEPADIIATLRTVLADAFEIEPARVTPEANLFTDLDLDSIDAVDLAIKLQEMTGRRIKAENFKAVRTVQDLVDTVRALQSQASTQAA